MSHMCKKRALFDLHCMHHMTIEWNAFVCNIQVHSIHCSYYDGEAMRISTLSKFVFSLIQLVCTCVSFALFLVYRWTWSSVRWTKKAPNGSEHLLVFPANLRITLQIKNDVGVTTSLIPLSMIMNYHNGFWFRCKVYDKSLPYFTFFSIFFLSMNEGKRHWNKRRMKKKHVEERRETWRGKKARRIKPLILYWNKHNDDAKWQIAQTTDSGWNLNWDTGGKCTIVEYTECRSLCKLCAPFVGVAADAVDVVVVIGLCFSLRSN